MINEILRGSLIAFVIWALSVFSLYKRLVPTYFFAAVLGAWFLYSAYRLLALIARRSATPGPDRLDKDAVAYWLGSVGSSLLAPLLWMLVVSHVSIF